MTSDQVFALVTLTGIAASAYLAFHPNSDEIIKKLEGVVLAVLVWACIIGFAGVVVMLVLVLFGFL